MTRRFFIRIGVLLGVAGSALTILWMSRPTGGLPARPSSVLMIDVMTGDIYRVRLDRGVIIPAANPRTGLFTLLPIGEGDIRVEPGSDGELEAVRDDGSFVSRRHLADVSFNHEIIDAATGRVLVEVGTPLATIE